MIQTGQKKANRLCYFSDGWNDTYNWVKEVNNGNRVDCTNEGMNSGLGLVEKGCGKQIWKLHRTSSG